MEATGKIHGRHCRMDFDLEKKHATGWLIKSVNPFEEPQKSKQKQASDLKVETLTIRQGTLAMPKAKTTANKPLGSVESSEHKFVSDPFQEGRAELVAEGGAEADADAVVVGPFVVEHRFRQAEAEAADRLRHPRHGVPRLLRRRQGAGGDQADRPLRGPRRVPARAARREHVGAARHRGVPAGAARRTRASFAVPCAYSLSANL